VKVEGRKGLKEKTMMEGRSWNATFFGGFDAGVEDADQFIGLGD
jgi:hypothetical protein